MRRVGIALLMIVLSACASRNIDTAQESRSIVEAYIKDSNAKTAGPIKRLREEDAAHFSSSDRAAISALLKEGADAFLVLVPDYSLSIHTPGGRPEEMMKVERIVVVKDGRIAGDFHREERA